MVIVVSPKAAAHISLGATAVLDGKNWVGHPWPYWIKRCRSQFWYHRPCCFYSAI